MVPRKIEIVCPKCNYKNRSIQADMGNQTIRCAFVAGIFTILGELEK